jgi:hypothetical protein
MGGVEIMATWRVNNSTALGGEVCSPWRANHAYATGARCVCRVAYGTTAARAFVFEVTDDGTSHATTEPTWPTTVGNTVSDGTVTWTCRTPSDGSWDNASCYLYYITNHAAAAGDTIYIDDGHSEAGIGATLSVTGSTTFTNPFKIYCVDKASDALSTGAVVASGNQDLRLSGFVYSYGTTFSAGSGQIIFSRLSDSNWILEGNNTTVLSSSSVNNIIGYSSNYKCYLTVINGNIELNNGSGATSIQLGTLAFRWYGGKLVSSIGVDNLLAIEASSVTHRTELRDVDLEDIGQGATTSYIVNLSSGDACYDILLTRCKLPSDAGFAVTDSEWMTPYQGKVALRHCSSANQSYDFFEQSYEGTCQDETTIVRTGGASDGTTGISCKMDSSSGCLENMFALESIPITGWTSSTTEKTFTIEFIHDSATALQDDEIWMELEYPANNTDGLGAIAKSKCAVLGTPADTADSSETWTTTGLTNPNTRKLSVTVTPGKAGPICARVYLAKASTTVYVDLMITES